MVMILLTILVIWHMYLLVVRLIGSLRWMRKLFSTPSILYSFPFSPSLLSSPVLPSLPLLAFLTHFFSVFLPLCTPIYCIYLSPSIPSLLFRSSPTLSSPPPPPPPPLPFSPSHRLPHSPQDQGRGQGYLIL